MFILGLEFNEIGMKSIQELFRLSFFFPFQFLEVSWLRMALLLPSCFKTFFSSSERSSFLPFIPLSPGDLLVQQNLIVDKVL